MTRRAPCYCADAATEIATALEHTTPRRTSCCGRRCSRAWPPTAAGCCVPRSSTSASTTCSAKTRAAAAAFRVEASAAHRDDLAATLAELRARVDEHMVDEERHVLPLVEANLSVAEWEQVGERARACIPKNRLLVQLGWILDGLTPAEQREFMAVMACRRACCGPWSGDGCGPRSVTRSTAAEPTRCWAT